MSPCKQALSWPLCRGFSGSGVQKREKWSFGGIISVRRCEGEGYEVSLERSLLPRSVQRKAVEAQRTFFLLALFTFYCILAINLLGNLQPRDLLKGAAGKLCLLCKWRNGFPNSHPWKLCLRSECEAASFPPCTSSIIKVCRPNYALYYNSATPLSSMGC